MASSKKSLDIDTLTFKTLYIRSQSASHVSSYTIPVIPSGDSHIKEILYMTPQEALSIGNININSSTIPFILSSIQTLSSSQTAINISISSISDIVGNDLSSIEGITLNYTNSILGKVYPSTISTLSAMASNIEATDISLSNFNGGVIGLKSTLSTIYFTTVNDFKKLQYDINVTYNQGPSISSLSTYISAYFNGLEDSIPFFSTSLGGAISTTVFQDNSTVIGYSNDIYSLFNSAAGPQVSSFSTFIGSNFSTYVSSLKSYNPERGLSSLSTTVSFNISTLSSQFIFNLGISGICSLSTLISQTNKDTINNIQRIAGSDGISSMSTYIYSSIKVLEDKINIYAGSDTLSTFSIALGNEINLISSQIFKIGYINTILQQEAVKKSITDLSTSLGLKFSSISSSIRPISNTIGPLTKSYLIIPSDTESAIHSRLQAMEDQIAMLEQKFKNIKKP